MTRLQYHISQAILNQILVSWDILTDTLYDQLAFRKLCYFIENATLES